MTVEPVSVFTVPAKLAGLGGFLSMDEVDYGVTHSPRDVDPQAPTSPKQSNIFRTPVKGKENCDMHQCTPSPPAAGRELLETPVKTPTKVRKAVGPCWDNAPGHDAAKALFSRDVQVKNTFVHMSPEHVKRPVETPPRSAPSNFWASESLFAKEMLAGLDEDATDGTSCASDVASAAAQLMEHDAGHAEPVVRPRKPILLAGSTNVPRLPVTPCAWVPSSPFTVPPTPEIFNRSDADRLNDHAHFPAVGLPPPLPHGVDSVGFAPSGAPTLGSTNTNAASIAAAAAFGMAQAASAFAAAAAKNGVAADTSIPPPTRLPPPPAMLPPPPLATAPTPPSHAVPPPPQLTPGAVSMLAPEGPTKVIRLLEHIAAEQAAPLAALASNTLPACDARDDSANPAHGAVPLSSSGWPDESATAHFNHLMSLASSASSTMPSKCSMFGEALISQQVAMDARFHESQMLSHAQLQPPVFPYQQAVDQYQQQLNQVVQAQPALSMLSSLQSQIQQQQQQQSVLQVEHFLQSQEKLLQQQQQQQQQFLHHLQLQTLLHQQHEQQQELQQQQQLEQQGREQQQQHGHSHSTWKV